VQCPALRALVAGAPAGSRLAVSYLPPIYGYDVLHATIRSAGWTPDYNRYVPDAVSFTTPGVAGKVIDVPRSGEYRVWIQGSSPRVLRVTLAHTGVGAPAHTISEIGGTNTPDEWMEGATVHVTSDHWAFDVWRPSGDLSPGDGGTGESDQGRGEIGYLALVSEQPPRLDYLPRSRWRTLCGQQADWVELVAGASS
jgi:hypothetical protein